jgi:hypothetical protein
LLSFLVDFSDLLLGVFLQGCNIFEHSLVHLPVPLLLIFQAAYFNLVLLANLHHFLLLVAEEGVILISQQEKLSLGTFILV